MLTIRTGSEIGQGPFQEATDSKVVVEKAELYMKVTAKDRKFINSNRLDSEFRYREIDTDGLKNFLSDRQSLLAREPYFSVIMNMSRKYNVNPLLMIAITGQEQNFVPIYQKEARKIANNPFNVYGSWQKYNTNIVEASEIAARTIINLSENKPGEYDTIKWLNKRYAEDPKWHIGVTKFFNHLESTYDGG